MLFSKYHKTCRRMALVVACFFSFEASIAFAEMAVPGIADNSFTSRAGIAFFAPVTSERMGEQVADDLMIRFATSGQFASGGLWIEPLMPEVAARAGKTHRLVREYLSENGSARTILKKLAGVKIEIALCMAVTDRFRYYGACTSLEKDAAGEKMVIYVPLVNRRGWISYGKKVAKESDAAIAGATFTYLERIMMHEFSHVYFEGLGKEKQGLWFQAASSLYQKNFLAESQKPDHAQPSHGFLSAYSAQSPLEYLVESLSLYFINSEFVRERDAEIAAFFQGQIK